MQIDLHMQISLHIEVSNKEGVDCTYICFKPQGMMYGNNTDIDSYKFSPHVWVEVVIIIEFQTFKHQLGCKLKQPEG